MKLLIVVDYQNDFVNGSLGFEKAQKIENAILRKIKKYHKEEQEVIYTLDSHNSDYLDTLEGKFIPIEHCIMGTTGHDLYNKVFQQKKERDKVFIKNTFPCLELANFLKDRDDIEEVELCGVVTNICVLSNAIMVRSALPNTKIIIDKKATASNNDLYKKYSLKVMESMGFEIL